MNYSLNSRWFKTVLVLFVLCSGLLAQRQKQNYQMRIARSLETNQEFSKALKIYLNEYNNGNNSIAVVNGVRRCYTSLRDYPALITFLQNASGAANNKSWRIELGEAYVLNDQKKQALGIWQDEIDKQKNNVGIYRLVAGAMIRHRLYDEAIAVYRQGLQNVKGASSFYLDIANLYRAQLNTEKATENYLQYFRHNPKQYTFMQRQILNLTGKARSAEPVVKAINNFIESNPGQNRVREILGGLYIKERDFSRAFDVYQQLDETIKGGQYLLRFATEAFKNEAWNEAIKGYDHFLTEHPDTPMRSQARFGLADSYASLAFDLRKKGNVSDAEKAMTEARGLFRHLADSSRNVYTQRSIIRLGDINFKFYFDLDTAARYYQKFLNRYKRHQQRAEVTYRLASVYLTLGDSERAAGLFKQISQPKQRNAALFMQAEIAFYNGDFDAALNRYGNLIKIAGPADSLTNNALQRQLLITTYRDNADALKLFAQAEYFIFQRKLSQAAGKFSDVFSAQNALSPLAARNAARLLIRLKKYDQAEELLTSLLEKYPEDTHTDQALYMMGGLLERKGETENALKLYQKLMVRFPASLHYENARNRARELRANSEKEQS